MTPSIGGSAERPLPGADHDKAELRTGLFGPGSVTWRLHADPLYPLACLRALVMQVLDVPAMSVVFASARRLDDPWDRLHHSLGLLGTVTFGDAAEAAIMGARDRSLRMQVHGARDDGSEFRGDDPEVLAWMHACQVNSAIEIATRGGMELSDADIGRYLREQARTAAVLGLEPDQVPRSRGEVLRCLRAHRPALRVTHEARAFLSAVVSQTLPGPMLTTQRHRPAWAPVAGLTFATLPAWARRSYGPPPPGSSAALGQAATTVALHALRDSLLGRTVQTGLAVQTRPAPTWWSPDSL